MAFFEEFEIKLPITDEFVDATFRELDQDKNNAIEEEELQAYANHFMATMSGLFGVWGTRKWHRERKVLTNVFKGDFHYK